MRGICGGGLQWFARGLRGPWVLVDTKISIKKTRRSFRTVSCELGRLPAGVDHGAAEARGRAAPRAARHARAVEHLPPRQPSVEIHVASLGRQPVAKHEADVRAGRRDHDSSQEGAGGAVLTDTALGSIREPEATQRSALYLVPDFVVVPAAGLSGEGERE